MEINKIEAIIEAILFSTGAAVHINKIAEVIEQDLKTTRSILSSLSERYQKEHHGIKIICMDQSYQLCTKSEYYEHIKQITNKTPEFSLTEVLVETLSIIAYKQPITKSQIEEIRGVNTNHAVNRLVEYQLVTELGRLNAPGRPVLFGTSQEFLRCFGLESIDHLPYLEGSLDEEQLKFLE